MFRISEIALLVVLGLALAVGMGPVYGADTRGNVQEVLTLPNGMEVMPLGGFGTIKSTGAPGAWGANPHDRDNPTVNNQFNPQRPEGGTYTNSNGLERIRYATTADKNGDATFAIVDANDLNRSKGFRATARGRDESGAWGTLGDFKITNKEDSGTVHYITVHMTHAYQRVVVWFKQNGNPRDIVGYGKACKG